MWKDLFGASAKTIVVGRVVTATVTLICVLVVYDGWANLRFRDAVIVVVGPVLAIYVSHLYSGTLVQHMELGRRPTWREWVITVRFESRFLVLAGPPVAVMVILDLVGVSLTESIRVIIWLEALSLSFWAGLAAHRAGLRGQSLVLAVLAGLVVTGVVIGLQVVLEPGKAVQNGVTAGRTLTTGLGPKTSTLRSRSSRITTPIESLQTLPSECRCVHHRRCDAARRDEVVRMLSLRGSLAPGAGRVPHCRRRRGVTVRRDPNSLSSHQGDVLAARCGESH